MELATERNEQNNNEMKERIKQQDERIETLLKAVGSLVGSMGGASNPKSDSVHLERTSNDELEEDMDTFS